MPDKRQTNTLQTAPKTAMTASEYADLVAVAFPDAKKPEICTALGISRPTHDSWLKNGIQSHYRHSTAQASRDEIRERARGHAERLEARAQAIRAWLADNG